MRTIIAILFLITASARGAQLFTPMLVVDSLNTLRTRTPVIGESITVLGTSAAFDTTPRIAKNYPAGSFLVDGVTNLTAVGGSIWHLEPFFIAGTGTFQPYSTNLNTLAALTGGTLSNFFRGDGTFATVSTNDVDGLVALFSALNQAKQPASTALSNLTANPSLYQSTNANLTAVAAGGTSSNYFRGDGSFAQVLTNQIPGLVGDVANLQTAISARQPASSVLTNVAALTSGTSTNFLAGDGTFKQTTTNMVPGLVGDVGNLQSAINAKQATNSALTAIIGGDGSALTNVARIGLGQPEVSGVAFDGVSGTKLSGTAQNIGTNDFSVWTRFKVTTSSDAAYREMLKLSPNGAYVTNAFDMMCFSGSLLVNITGTTNTSDYNLATVSSFTTTYGGKIVDLVATRQGTNLVLYLNGTNLAYSASSGGTPPTWGGTITSTRYDVGGYLGIGTAVAYNAPIYRTAVFNRALSQADITSLVNNGIDPADQWGTQTDIVGPSTLNGGFETLGAGGADIWGTWVEFTGASSTLTNATGAQALYGSNSLYMARTNSADATGVQQSLTLQPNRRYRISAWAKSAANGTQLYIAHVQNTSPALAYVGLTTNWAYYSNEGVTTSSAAGNFQIIPASGQVGSIWVDNVQLTPIGAILDLDFTTGYGTNVWDRSSNSLNATNYGGVAWTMPVNAINTGTLLATNVTVSGPITATSITTSGTETVGNETVLTNQTVAGTLTASIAAVTNSTTVGSLTVNTNAAVAGTLTASLATVTNSVTLGGLTVNTNAAIAGTATISILTVTNSTRVGGLIVNTNVQAAGNVTANQVTATNHLFSNGGLTVSSNTLSSTLAITPSSATNFVLNFGNSLLTYTVTNNVNWQQSTNRPGSSTQWAQTVVILGARTTNYLLSFPATWTLFSTNNIVVPSNKVCQLEARCVGTAESGVSVEIDIQP